MSEISQMKKDIYGLLAYICNIPPSLELIENLKKEEVRELINYFSGEAGHKLYQFLDNFAGDIAPIKQDFMDLFKVPLKKYITPYESVYVDEPIVANDKAKKCTFGPSTQKVTAFYEHVGLKISKDYEELPDYIGLELACMEYLYTKETEFREEGKEDLVKNTIKMEEIFLGEHLQKWVPMLTQRILENSQTDFYKSIAILTKDTVVNHSADRPGAR